MKQIEPPEMPSPNRRIFSNRTLNLRQVRAVGYDMDYTLIHYRVEEWERRAYDYAKKKLAAQGWPVAQLDFVHDLMVRGLILDTQLGNVIKVNSYGYVKQAFHGTRPLDYETQRNTYTNVVVSLADSRFVFLNTLFSLSEACMYAQAVDLLDAQQLPQVLGYADVYRRVRSSLDEAHLEGQLKAEIVADPDRFVALDPETPLALLDQRNAGKKLLLITNSDWNYTRALMGYVFDRYLPAGMHWRELFSLVLVSARKPEFFAQRAPLFDVVSDDGLLRPNAGGMQQGQVYWGGDATAVEQALGLSGDDILYVGDHIYGDVNVSKKLLRWRTALVLRELEQDLAALEQFGPQQQRLEELMARKEQLEHQICAARLVVQRWRQEYAVAGQPALSATQQRLAALRHELEQLDDHVRPLAEAAARLSNVHWGPLMRAGNDKSHLARQVERYADIYMSRVSNFLHLTPFSYVRSMRTSLPHDPGMAHAPERLESPVQDGGA